MEHREAKHIIRKTKIQVISEDDGDFMKALSKLQKNGVSIRTLEAITGIPRSTLSYRFNKEGKLDE